MRNPSLELLRIVMMFGIVLEHSISQGGGYSNLGLDRVLDSCVDGFVFISGYFGMRFKWNKVSKMLALAIWSAFVLNFLRIFLVGDRTLCSLPKSAVFTVVHSTGWWFLWAYLAVMMFAPLVECAFKSVDRATLLKAVIPIFGLVFGWSWLSIVPGIKNYIPSLYGAMPLSFLTLFGVYLAARVFRVFGLERFLTVKVLLMGSTLAIILAFAGSWHHNSLPMLFLATVWFVLFKRLRVSGRIESIVLYLSPSMFGVYLLHVSGVGYHELQRFNSYFIETQHLPIHLGLFLSAIIVFTACLTLDLARRILLAGCRNFISQWKRRNPQ